MKKLLSIILAILMIVTSVPIAFAAESDTDGTTIVITMTDSYGDGWDYNAIQVGFVSEGVFTKIADATIDDGSTATYETTISDGKVVAFRWTEGDCPNECSFTISADGEIIFEKSDCSDLADNELIYIYCNHNFTDSVCSICGLTCGVDFSHNMNGGTECTACGFVCNHNYTNHYCKACSQFEDGYYAGACGANDVNDVIWSLNSEGTLIISGEGEYDITYCDAPWNAYGENIKNVVIEEGITNIDEGSFWDLPNTVTLSIPSTVTTIDITYNNGFVEIKLADGNNSYKLIDGVLFNYDKTELIMYPAKKAGETYTVPDGVTILGGYAFDSSNNLKTVNISDDVTTIKYSCFANSYSIENINFGKNVEVIEVNAFLNTGLKTVVLPEKLTEISLSLFFGCNSLENLVIGSNVTKIGKYVLDYCYELKTAHFLGTEEQWQAITKPDDSADPINTIEIHFGALEEKEAIDATCTEAGHTSGLYCDECNAYITGEVIPATGEHIYVDGKCECGDECKHPGQTGAECEICGKALHVCDFSGEWKYDVEKHWKECTCGEISEEATHTYIDGVCECGYECDHEGQTGTCTICGKVLHVCDFSGEFTYNDEEHWKVCSCGEISEEATHTYIDGACECGYECDHEGQTGATCEICGSALHVCDFSGEWQYDSENHWKNCSCGVSDTKSAHTFIDGVCECGYVCSHNYTNHYCKACGKVEDGYYAGACGAEKAEDAIWSLDAEGTLTISGEGEYSVPFYDAPWLAYKESIKNVVIEEGITNIPWTSFYGLFNAVSLSIPSTVASIDPYYNNGFAEIKVADGNNYYSVIDGVLFNHDKTELIMYPVKKADETYTVPDGVKTLGKNAFNFLDNLKTINISDDVTTIKDSCFEYASVESINFGKNVEVIESGAFAYVRLKTVVLPEKLTEIHDSVFWACASLEILVIGSKVTSIDNDIISYCDNIETVHFTGTEEQWQAITKPDNSADPINTIEVHFGALEEKEAIDATCTEVGHTASLYCDECNAYITGEVIPATGEHIYVDGKCDSCGADCPHENITDGKCDACGAEGKIITITMNDSYGDGWNGNAVVIERLIDGTYTEVATATIEDGGSGILTVILPEVSFYALKWKEGNYTDECSFTVAENDETVFEASDGSVFSDGEYFYSSCKHIYVDGKCGICGYDCPHENITDGICECGKFIYKITHQPTEEEPWVELNNDTDAPYQWYYVEKVYTELTDKNVLAETYDGYETSYSEDEGWTGHLDTDYNFDCVGYFMVDLKKGETLEIELSEAVTDGYLCIWETDGSGCDDKSFSGTSLELTAPSDGIYELYSADIDESVKLRVNKSGYVCETEVEGENSAELNYPVVGKTYACKVTCGDGETVLTSDFVKFAYAITHQPTAEEPWVELNDDTDATYQWYTNHREDTEITDENADPFTKDNTTTSYNEETGWTGIHDGNELANERSFFTVELKQGQAVTVEFSGEVEGWVYLYAGNTNTDSATVQEGKRKYVLIAGGDDTYRLVTRIKDEEVTVKAYCTEFVKTPVEGQTSSTLFPKEIANYFCLVTFADGTTEMSDIFSVTELHSCDFSGEWKYDSEKHWKECLCGVSDTASAHTYIDGACECGYECSHKWIGVAFARPTRTEEGYYTYTCSICKDTKIELVERASNYAKFKELLEKVKGYLDENLTDSMMQEVNNVINFFDLDENHRFIKGEEDNVSQLAKQLNEFIEVVEEGIADGSAVKVDGLEEIVNINDKLNNELAEKYGEEALAEISEKLDEKFADKFDELYERAEALTGSVAENKDALGEIEAEMEAIFAEAENCLNGTHNGLKFEVIEEAKCGKNAVESTVCALCGEKVTREVENSALTHSFTKYEVTEEAKCGVEGKEVAACDNGCGATDEKTIAALTHKDADGDYKCDNGCGHEFEKPAPEEPTDKACDHLCHKGGFVGFIWKIVQFFWKLFKMNPVCACGAAHY